MFEGIRRRRAIRRFFFNTSLESYSGSVYIFRRDQPPSATRAPFTEALFSLVRDFNDHGWNEFLCELSRRLCDMYWWHAAYLNRLTGLSPLFKAWRAQLRTAAQQHRGMDAFQIVIRDVATHVPANDDVSFLLRGIADAWVTSDDPRLGALVAETGGIRGQREIPFARCQLKRGNPSGDVGALMQLTEDRDSHIAGKAFEALTQQKPVDLLEKLVTSDTRIRRNVIAMAVERYEKEAIPAPTTLCLRALIELGRHGDADIAARSARILDTYDAPRAWTLLGVGLQVAADSDVEFEQLAPSTRLTIEFAIPRLDRSSCPDAELTRIVDQLQRACTSSRKWLPHVAQMLPEALKDLILSQPHVQLTLAGAIGGDAARSAYIDRHIEARWQNAREWAEMRRLLQGLEILDATKAASVLDRCLTGNDKYTRDWISASPLTADETIRGLLRQAWHNAHPDSEESAEHECISFFAAAHASGSVLESTRSRSMSSRTQQLWTSIYVVRMGDDAFLDGASSAIEYLD